jgi:Ca-activated chloride channel family protein
MQGARLDTVKSAAIELIRQTRVDDVISLVTFSDRAEVLISATRQHDRKFFETQIQLIHASGGTEIFQGLDAGYQQLQRNLNRALVNHIILITDGHTYGDEKACLEIANHAAAQGVRITALGIGTEWNDSFLDELSNLSGGSTFYISKTDDLRKMMHSKFANLNQVFGERVILKLDTAPGVSISSVFRLNPDPTHLGTSGQIRLGNILKSDSLGVLLEFIIQPNDEKGYRSILATGCLELILPFKPSATQSLPIYLSLVNGKPDPEERPPAKIIQALTSITLYRMQARAREEVSDGKPEEASKRLQHMATQLMSLGEDELAHTALMEVERIQQTNLLSAEGAKLIKYATRALLLPAWTRKGEQT